MEGDADPFDPTWERMLDELSGESERACAIVGVAYLDDLLGVLLEHYLIENQDAYRDLLDPDNINAPLSSFGARVTMAYALGLVSHSQFGALRKLKKIRNRFGHDIDMSFSDAQVASLSLELKALIPGLHYLDDPPGPREVFQAVVAGFSGKFSEQLRLMRQFGVTGRYAAVLRLVSRIPDELSNGNAAA